MLSCVVLCASHVDSPERAQLLKRCVRSLTEQTHRIPIHVSVSGVDSIDLEGANVYVRGQKKLSQFEHYDFLAGKIRNPDATFCLFTDDDDYSHPERCRFYASCEDRGQISMLALDGTMMLSSQKIIDGREYFMFCVRASYLQNYCKALKNHGVLKSSVCDVLFGSLLMHSEHRSRSVKPCDWIYAYNDDPNKIREHETDEYERLIGDDGLMKTLESIFGIASWTRGKTCIYGD